MIVCSVTGLTGLLMVLVLQHQSPHVFQSVAAGAWALPPL